MTGQYMQSEIQDDVINKIQSGDSAFVFATSNLESNDSES